MAPVLEPLNNFGSGSAILLAFFPVEKHTKSGCFPYLRNPKVRIEWLLNIWGLPCTFFGLIWGQIKILCGRCTVINLFWLPWVWYSWGGCPPGRPAASCWSLGTGPASCRSPSPCCCTGSTWSPPGSPSQPRQRGECKAVFRIPMRWMRTRIRPKIWFRIRKTPESGSKLLLNTAWKKYKKNFIIIRFSRKKKSIERKKVLKSKIIFCSD